MVASLSSYLENWLKLRKWQRNGGFGIPWVLDLGDHREIAGNPVTPLSLFKGIRQSLTMPSRRRVCSVWPPTIGSLILLVYTPTIRLWVHTFAA